MAQIKLILREEVEKLGRPGDLVAVKPGYARNYLLPKGKASLATAARIKELEHHRRVIADEQAKTLADLESLKRKIESITLEVEAQAGGEGKLFGSVTMQNVADMLAQKGVEIDRRKLQADDVIKSLGEHEVSVRLHPELVAKVKLVVTASGVVAPVADADDDAAAAVEASSLTDESTVESDDEAS